MGAFEISEQDCSAMGASQTRLYSCVTECRAGTCVSRVGGLPRVAGPPVVLQT